MNSLKHAFSPETESDVLAHAHRLEIELVRTQERYTFDSAELQELRRRYASLKEARGADATVIEQQREDLARLQLQRTQQQAAIDALRAEADEAKARAQKMTEERDIWQTKVAREIPVAQAALESARARYHELERRYARLEDDAAVLEERERAALSRANLAEDEVSRLRSDMERREAESARLSKRYLAEIQAVTEGTRHEREKLEQMAQIVRTSKFWKLKTFIRRVAGPR